MMEDMREPQRRLPIVVMISLAIVTVAYILANIAYFATLPKDTVMNSPAIAFDSGKSVASSYGGSNGAVGYCIGALPTIFAVGVALSTAGAVNGSVMAGGRAIWGVARDGMLPPILAKTNKAGAPYASLLAQAAWSIVLLLLPGASFSSLLDYFGPASWFFYAMSCTALVRLRQIEPDTYRPYKLPFYPYPVVFVVIIAAVIVISSFAKVRMCTLWIRLRV
jgi:amino acid transporter